MSYLGNAPRFGDYPVKTFTGNGSLTSFSLDHSVPSDASILVSIAGVRQHVGSYSAAGTASLDFGAGNPPANGTSIEVVHLGLEATLNTPADASVTAGKINASGSASASTFLRGDMAWQSVPAGAPPGSNDEAVFFNNENQVDNSYTIPTNFNSLSAGPVAIASGVTVTIPSGSVWVIV